MCACVCACKNWSISLQFVRCERAQSSFVFYRQQLTVSLAQEEYDASNVKDQLILARIARWRPSAPFSFQRRSIGEREFLISLMSFLRFRWVIVVKESDAVATRTSRHAQTQTHTQKRAYKRGIFHRGRVKLYILNVNLFFQRSVVDYYDRRWTRVSKKSAKEQRFRENARAKERENEREWEQRASGIA